jgi:hypothetical protein
LHGAAKVFETGTRLPVNKFIAAGSNFLQGARKELNKNWRPGEMRLLSHKNMAFPVGNAVNGFSQRQCWRLVLLDQADLSRLK